MVDRRFQHVGSGSSPCDCVRCASNSAFHIAMEERRIQSVGSGSSPYDQASWRRVGWPWAALLGKQLHAPRCDREAALSARGVWPLPM
ncbi:hypothetical protein NDU88_004620 [Pleurodeles waltl]|uniref:Uncharacterized protein n=1 Tax=Pleurodeles waltl TaxID=8319 RepID=A0AAV7MVF7_PLEWA|nr:hypothetical protein NDU88_004620 [Pleurodeles waltl]